jgi:cytochrome c
MAGGRGAAADAAGGVQEGRVEPNAAAVQDGHAQFNNICALCHTDKPNMNRIGPSLFGVVGRHAGSAPGYNYSEAMKQANVTWNEETLDKYLSDPKAFVPGNKMPYLGVKQPELRSDIIAYLRTLR